MDLNQIHLYPQSSITLGILFFMATGLFAQDLSREIVPHKKEDTQAGLNYREDQFYLGLTFNFMSDMPKGVSQSGFSGGLHLGFIRDFPLNAERNFGIGLGVGWSVNTYRTNLLISRDESGHSIFQVLHKNEFDFKFNRFATQLVEVPFELRWRTSSEEEYRFWRVYAGVKIGYIYHFRSNFSQPGKHIKLTDIDDLNRMRYGLTFTFGYNTFNFTVYYSLNSFFNGHTLDQQAVDLRTIKIGLMFYIL